MPVGTFPLAVPTLDLDAESVRRALQAARAPAAAVAAVRPDVRAVLPASRAARREFGAAPHAELLQHACLVRFAASAWPVRDFQRCVLTCVAAHWLGAGQPFGWIENGPGVFRVLESDAVAAAAQPLGQRFHTADAGLRPAFQPEVLSLSCCLNRARAGIGLVDVDSLLAGLPAGLRETALQQRFRHAVGTGIEEGADSAPRSLFWNSPRGAMAALDLARTRPARPGDAAALQVLREVDLLARQRAAWLQLQPGEVLFLRNHRVLHALHGSAGPQRMLSARWRGSLLALGNFAGTGTPGMFSMARAQRAPGAR